MQAELISYVYAGSFFPAVVTMGCLENRYAILKIIKDLGARYGVLFSLYPVVFFTDIFCVCEVFIR